MEWVLERPWPGASSLPLHIPAQSVQEASSLRPMSAIFWQFPFPGVVGGQGGVAGYTCEASSVESLQDGHTIALPPPPLGILVLLRRE